MFALQPQSGIWLSLSADQQRIVIDLLARLAIKAVRPTSPLYTQEFPHGSHQ